ncbi:hypothetical protein BDL97_16G055800 [Sphagnum fallax]|nr:hypothetical protein BDL97_16G055800 [Sphagnum fallax]KAH8937927.1 hypothetical protein BDL97_16G055800 [Sphagnum fallax]
MATSSFLSSTPLLHRLSSAQQACNLGKKGVFSPTQVQFSGVDNTVSCQGILFQNNSFTTPKTSLQQQDVRRMSSVHAGSNWTSLDRCGGALQRSNWISHTWSQINKAPLHCDQGRTKKAVAVASLPLAAGQGSLMMAGALFTFGTAFVVPLYTTMVVAPHWDWTKKLAETSFPYMVLGALYIYLLSLSWTSETLRLMFSSKYWLPELPGITRMFSSTITVASAWIHLLAVDLFCGRHVYLDGLQHNVETRHSLVLCLMMCPIGIISHLLTKAVTLSLRSMKGDQAVEVATVSL